MEVVNMYSKGFSWREGDLYIGRAGKGQSGTFGNPYSIGKDGNREEVLVKYEEYLKRNLTLIRRIKEMKKVERLVCFCKPLPCHGDIIKRYVEEEREKA